MAEISALNVLKFAEARASEIASLMEDVKHKKNKTAVQKLPPHMRRRAASHNPKRVPRKLRESYLVQNPHATSKPKKAPKKIRKKQQKKKHQKQTKNYPEEYAKRSRPDAVWLGTHIWHAKRCKMDNLWGYKLAIHCNDKKLGATHQAATKHAMLQDLSYYCCICLKGPEDKLSKYLNQLTDPQTGFHFASELYRDGSREGHTFLYHHSKFPFEAIGPVTFIWKPVSNNGIHKDQAVSNERSLWLWCHPSFHDELVEVLMKLFELREVICDETIKIEFTSKVNFEKTKQHFLNKNLFANEDIQMLLLKDKLVRHRLIGPSALTVLTNVLEIANFEPVEKPTKKAIEISKTDGDNQNELKSLGSFVIANNHQSETKQVNNGCKIENNTVTAKNEKPKENLNGTVNNPKQESIASEESHDLDEPPTKKIKVEENFEVKSELTESDTSQKWWHSYYKSEYSKNLHEKQKKLLNLLRNGRSGYYIPPSSVIGFTVRDPRLILSHNKPKFIPMEDNSNIADCMNELLNFETADSPLWDNNIRDEVTATQISEHEINEERKKYIISSESLDLGNRESRIPVLLMHQAGVNGFGSGWDLIAPLGWSMGFWVPLVLNGGRASGLRDLHFVNLETGQASFPLSYPDTKSGSAYEEKQRLEEMTRYFRRPKSKRANFSAFGVPNPYFMPWDVFVDDWEKELRSQPNDFVFPCETISNLDSFLGKTDSKKGFFVLRGKEVRLLQNLLENVNRLPKIKGGFENLKQAFNELVSNVMNSQPQFMRALVLTKFKCLRRGCPTVHSGVYALSESDLKDFKCNPEFLGPVEPNHNKNKTVHETKKESSETQEKSSPQKQENSESSLPDQIKSKDLERPLVQTLIACSSRKMVGYLSEGGFSSISGKGCGIGHCSFIGLLCALRDCMNATQRPLVLLREQHSFQYRLASLEVLPNYL